jgi:hypothetical protein
MGSEVAVMNGSSVVMEAKTKIAALSEETMTALVLHGNLSKLSPAQKVEYYRGFCERVGLDPATQPFKLLTLNGKEILYCDRGGTAQLNKVHRVSHTITSRSKDEDIYMVVARASTPDGRQTESIGAVNIAGLRGEALANAMMKAETKSKRRSTLDLLGLGMLDETEVDAIPGAQPAAMDRQEPPAFVPVEESPEVQAGWKKLRAKANKSFTEAKTPADMAAKREAFESYCKLAETIWTRRTYHNAEETFGMLFDQHKQRVDRDAELASQAGVEMWLKALEGCSSVHELHHYVTRFRSDARLQNVKCEDALQAKALALGLPSYGDVDQDLEDELADITGPNQ